MYIFLNSSECSEYSILGKCFINSILLEYFNLLFHVLFNQFHTCTYFHYVTSHLWHIYSCGMLLKTFATLSPIPGFMQWLLSKLASQLKLGKTEAEDASTLSHMGSGSVFRDNILLPEEENMIVDSSV